MNPDSTIPVQSKLTASDVAALAAGVAELTRAGLPLPAGLRALAAELPGWRLPAALREMADCLDRGDSLESVLEFSAVNLPPHFHGLLVAGLRTGRLPELLEEYIQVAEKQRRLRQRLRLSLAYPIFLMLFMTGLVFFFQFYLLSGFEKIFKDFGSALPMITVAYFATFKYLPWVMLGLVGFMLLIPVLVSDAPGLGWFSPVAYHVPLVGKLLKYSRWALFSRFTAMLLENQTPLPQALRLIAAGLSDPYLSWACRESAVQVENGHKLSAAMQRTGWFPQSLIPFVQWGEQANTLPEAFSSANKMYEGRAESQNLSLTAIFLPIMFILIVLLAGISVLAIMMPLISLITSLTGGGHK
jgi:type II secretory pathway component PulF